MKIIQGALGMPASERSNVIDHKQPPHPKNIYKVLFLCPDNSICSIMAEALLKRWGGNDFHAFSAGVARGSEIHPFAADLLKTHNVWDQGLRSKGCDEFLAPDSPPMDFVVTVGGRPPVGMPTAWPGKPQVMHWRITDPVLDGKPKEKAYSFNTAFRELETRIKLFVLVYQREALKGIAAAA